MNSILPAALWVAIVPCLSLHAADADEAAWVDVLPLIDEEKDAVVGEWSRGEAGLAVAEREGARIMLPVRPQGEYDFRVAFTRHTGRDSMALIFTAAGGQATFEVDAWGRHLAGIQQVGGRTLRDNIARREDVALENGRKYVALVEVRKDRIRVLLDDREIASLPAAEARLSMLDLWRVPDAHVLGLGAWNSRTTFHSVEVRGVGDGRALVARSEIAPDARRPASARPVGGTPRSAPSTRPSPGRPTADSPEARRVLLVIANQHFFYREYADPRAALEQVGLRVEVAAGRKETCYPHPGSGEESDGGGVMPDLALSEVDPARYEAIVFSGGWGSSMYQYAFRGRYDTAAYNGDASTKEVVNRLINQFVAQDKYVCGICNGVTVLAWSRVNEKSLLDGRNACAPTRDAPAGIYNGQRAQPPIRRAVELNGARLTRPGSVGDPRTSRDDVVIDGKILTAEDDAAAGELGRQLARLLTRD